MNEALIELQDISVSFDQRPILQHINMRMEAGEIITLIGPNGAGKTTLIRVVLGLLEPHSGRRAVSTGLRIGYMPQKLHIEPTLPLTVQRFLGLAERFSQQEMLTALDQVSLSKSILKSPVQNVSGGEMQRILLARALLRKPQLLVLDEPAQGVDVNGQRELYQLIRTIRDTTQCAVLMVSHDLHLVMAATDQVLCINQHICCSGHPSQVSQDPAYLKLFGIDSDELAVYSHHHNHRHDLDGHIVNSANNGDDHNV